MKLLQTWNRPSSVMCWNRWLARSKTYETPYPCLKLYWMSLSKWHRVEDKSHTSQPLIGSAEFMTRLQFDRCDSGLSPAIVSDLPVGWGHRQWNGLSNLNLICWAHNSFGKGTVWQMDFINALLCYFQPDSLLWIHPCINGGVWPLKSSDKMKVHWKKTGMGNLCLKRPS